MMRIEKTGLCVTIIAKRSDWVPAVAIIAFATCFLVPALFLDPTDFFVWGSVAICCAIAAWLVRGRVTTTRFAALTGRVEIDQSDVFGWQKQHRSIDRSHVAGVGLDIDIEGDSVVVLQLRSGKSVPLSPTMGWGVLTWQTDVDAICTLTGLPRVDRDVRAERGNGRTVNV